MQLDVLFERGDDVGDIDHGVVDLLSTRQVGGVRLRVIARPAAGQRDGVHRRSAERVDGDRRNERRVDATGKPEDHRGEAVLAGVVAGRGDECVVDVGVRALIGRDAGRSTLVRLHRRGAQIDPLHRHRRAVAHRDRADAIVGGRGQPEIDDDESLVEAGRAHQRLAGRGDDERVAVEDQFVLAADHVDVGERGVRLARALLCQPHAHVALAPLVRRPVDVDDEADVGHARGGERPLVVPEVFAHRHGDVDAEMANDRQRSNPD